MTEHGDKTPDPDTNDEREQYVNEREESDGTVEATDDSERTVGRRPGDGTPEGVEIPDNDDVEPGNEPQPRSGRDDGAQDDGSDPVPDDEQEPGDDEPHNPKSGRRR